MTVGIKEEISEYLSQDEIETKLLIVIEFDEDTTYRFIADDTIDEQVINGETYLSASIVRGSREENADNSIDSIELTLSNKWQEWAAVLANRGNEFLGKKCSLMEWFPDYPDDEPVVMYEGILDDVKMTASEFRVTVVRVLGDYEQEAPLMTFDVNCQWVFKDCRCGYSGDTYYTCGKTLADCMQRKNVLNFGGYPSVPKEYLINK